MLISLTRPARRSTRFHWTFLFIIAALSLGACGYSQSEVEGNWQLVSGTQSGTELQLEASNPLTIEFDFELVSGHGGCNSFSGSYTLDGSVITFGPIASTQMACESLDLETMYMTGLGDVDTASSDGDQLTLSFSTRLRQLHSRKPLAFWPSRSHTSYSRSLRRESRTLANFWMVGQRLDQRWYLPHPTIPTRNAHLPGGGSTTGKRSLKPRTIAGFIESSMLR